jgi:hypothetical protein
MLGPRSMLIYFENLVMTAGYKQARNQRYPTKFQKARNVLWERKVSSRSHCSVEWVPTTYQQNACVKMVTIKRLLSRGRRKQCYSSSANVSERGRGREKESERGALTDDCTICVWSSKQQALVSKFFVRFPSESDAWRAVRRFHNVTFRPSTFNNRYKIKATVAY